MARAVDHPVLAPLVGIRDALWRPPPMGVLSEDQRCDGLVALVTGASSGLGFAVATDLARRGAHVYALGRSADDAVRQALVAASGSDRITPLAVDLADLEAVRRLAAELPELGLLVCNAGMVSVGSDVVYGHLERMLVVNHLANHLLLRSLREAGRLEAHARVVVVGSEAHRDAVAPTPHALHEAVPFGASGAMARYGTSKLLLTTLAMRLARTAPELEVHALCPGAIASNIARDVHPWLRPVLRGLLRLSFPSPAKAAVPVLYLALAPELAGRSGLYLHVGAERAPDARTLEVGFQDAVWERSEACLSELGL